MTICKCRLFIMTTWTSLAMVVGQQRRPHIILIVADDLGWNDVGFHGSNQIPTPNIDSLAYSGIILNNYYVDPICTPSRSALLTGRHPIHTGMYHYTIAPASPYGLPLSVKTLPQYLQNLGYCTHHVGKWHLGYHKAAYTPTRRGFNTSIGYYNGMQDYFDHTIHVKSPDMAGWGYDFRRNMSVAWEDYGNYATDIFTQEAVKVIDMHDAKSPLFLYLAHLAVHSANTYSPLQAPSDAIDRHKYIEDVNRRKFAGMLYKLDESVGIVVDKLKEKGILQDSVIIFTTDNGGPAAGFDLNYASNWPLRGVKDTLWEGGVRGAALLWSPLLKAAPRVSNQMMNIQDWLPTLYAAAGGDPSSLDVMDGMDMWKALSTNQPSPRNLMLHNIDNQRFISAVRVGEWKLLKGTTYQGTWDSWYGPSGIAGYNYSLAEVRNSKAAQAMASIGLPLHEDSVLIKLRKEARLDCKKPEGAEPCKPTQQVCLFNISADPCEYNNLVFKFPDIVRTLDSTLELFNSTSVPPRNKPIDKRADPKFWDYTWTNWCDLVEGGCPDSDREPTPRGKRLWDADIQSILTNGVS